MQSGSVKTILDQYKSQLEKLAGEPVTFHIIPDIARSHVHATIRDSKNFAVASFGMMQMPANCGIVISTGVLVPFPYAGKGIGRLLLEIREAAALLDGYTVAVETGVLGMQDKELNILKKNKYTEMERFVNNRTSSKIWWASKNLRGT